MKLSERQWAAIENLLPESRRTGRRGRPAADNRACVEGILWVLRSGARWRDLPPQYPSPATCWRRLRRGGERGGWLQARRALPGTLGPVRRRRGRRGIELIAPYRRHKRKKPYQDGRKLRRYRRRWKIERTFAWFSNFRRLQVRQDRILSVFQGFCHIACLLITLRYF